MADDPIPSMEVAEPPSIFHYTTANGLIGILTTQSLYATHSDFLNDESECKCIKEILIPIFHQELEELLPQLLSMGVIKNEPFNELGREIYNIEATNLLNLFVQTTNLITPFFVTSFCLHEPKSHEYQHGLLSQWRAYARRGFAIEFDERLMSELTQIEFRKYSYSAILSKMVTYDDHSKLVQPEQYTGIAKGIVRQISPEKYQAAISHLTGLRLQRLADQLVDNLRAVAETCCPNSGLLHFANWLS